MKNLSRLLVLFALLFSQAANAVIINSLPYNLTNGSLADATQVMANYNQIVTNVNTNAAHNGANTDITSLTGLTTPLAATYGGTVIYTGGTTGGSGNAQTLATVTPTSFSLTAGNIVTGLAGFTNTGATTLQVNGGTATAMRVETPAGLVALTGGEIFTGQAYLWLYDGTFFELVNPSTVQGSGIVAGTVTNAKLAGMNTATIKGNIAATGASPADLTSAQVAQLVSAFVTLHRQTFNAGGTYTPCAGLVYADMEVWGGGGGGGGAGGAGSAAGGGGGSGGYAKKTVSAATVGAPQTVTIGAAGTAGAATGGTPGGTGGTTSIGSIISATGGVGGSAQEGGANNPVAGGSAGVGSSGDINKTGLAGFGGSAVSNGVASGSGGSTSLGGAGIGIVSTVANVAGNAGAANSGSGGGGAISTGTGQLGGAGGSGYAVVTEYCDQ